MRLFQIIHSYLPYLAHFESKQNADGGGQTFEQHRQALLKDRFYAAHILLPALNNAPDAFYTMWDYPALQLKWARERGWTETNLKKILFAQIEEFKPDVFYNCSPIRFNAAELKGIGKPGTIKLAWFASPETHNIDFSVYHARLSNYPPFATVLPSDRFKSFLFQPSYDSAMGRYAKTTERPIDILFYGQYLDSYLKRRNKLVDQLIRFKESSGWRIHIALQYTPGSKSILPRFFPERCRRYLRLIEFPPALVKRNSAKPLYGLDLYEAISRSKIVFNSAVDMSGRYKVNMRNIEALGCGSHMISEEGIYPEGLLAGRDFTNYTCFKDFVEKACYFLERPAESRRIACQGHQTVSKVFSKEQQWRRFEEIVGGF